jgi:hypothetical protein
MRLAPGDVVALMLFDRNAVTADKLMSVTLSVQELVELARSPSPLSHGDVKRLILAPPQVRAPGQDRAAPGPGR